MVKAQVYKIAGHEKPHMNGRSIVIVAAGRYRYRYQSSFADQSDARRFARKVEGAVKQLGARVLSLDFWDELGSY